MLDSAGIRQLAYLVYVDDVTPMNADRLECAHVGGWNCVVGKGEFHKGDIAVYFEIDSKVPEVEPFASMEFLASKHFKIKSQKIRGVVSEGLLMPISAFGWEIRTHPCHDTYVDAGDNKWFFLEDDSRFLTKELNVTYAVVEDNARKASSGDKYKRMAQRHSKLARTKWWRWLYKYNWGKKILFAFFGRKRKGDNKDWPDGKFPGVRRTDQERVENMTWVLNDKTPYIRTQKCDGSSATYILARKGHKFEFYVCSRNVRMLKPDQTCFFGKDNYYWDAAIKYNIEERMKSYLRDNPELTFVCWQGELCSPNIQKNPHNLTNLHLFCFHWTDDTGRWDIRKAEKKWVEMGMEVVPIDEELYVLPDDFEELKASADGYYASYVCEGKSNCPREGYVYYKTTDPNFSFKNVSREYLLKRKE